MRRRGLRMLLLLVPLLLWLRVPLLGFALVGLALPFVVLFLRVHRSRGCEEKEQSSRGDTSNWIHGWYLREATFVQRSHVACGRGWDSGRCFRNALGLTILLRCDYTRSFGFSLPDTRGRMALLRARVMRILAREARAEALRFYRRKLQVPRLPLIARDDNSDWIVNFCTRVKPAAAAGR